MEIHGDWEREKESQPRHDGVAEAINMYLAIAIGPTELILDVGPSKVNENLACHFPVEMKEYTRETIATAGKSPLVHLPGIHPAILIFPRVICMSNIWALGILPIGRRSGGEMELPGRWNVLSSTWIPAGLLIIKDWRLIKTNCRWAQPSMPSLIPVPVGSGRGWSG